MNKISTYDPAIKFKPDYVWPEEGAERNCPKCETAMQLVDNDPTYLENPGGARNANGSFPKKT